MNMRCGFRVLVARLALILEADGGGLWRRKANSFRAAAKHCFDIFGGSTGGVLLEEVFREEACK